MALRSWPEASGPTGRTAHQQRHRVVRLQVRPVGGANPHRWWYRQRGRAKPVHIPCRDQRPRLRAGAIGQRWYNPITGTWTQQDTLDHPLDPANANRYAYAGDDPINGSDPSGVSYSECVLKTFRASAVTGAITGGIADVETAVIPGAAGGFVIGGILGLIGGTLSC